MNFKNISCAVFLFFLGFSSVYAEKREIACSEGYCVDLTPPPATALRLSLYMTNFFVDKIEPVRPEKWNIRAYVDLGYGVTEFDEQGNILTFYGRPVDPKEKMYIAELRLSSSPIWSGNQIVYYAITEGQFDRGSFASGAFITRAASNGRMCRALNIGEEYLEYRLNFQYHNDVAAFLDGDCDKAVKRKFKGHHVWVYKEEAKTPEKELDYYWDYQLFDEPVRPMYDSSGKCIYACDMQKK